MATPLSVTEAFVLLVREDGNQNYRLSAFFRGAPLATATISMALSELAPGEIDQATTWLQRGVIDADFARDFGARLFATLFPPPILEALETAKDTVARTHADAGQLRLVLYLPHALEAVPWELLYDGDEGFLARSENIPISRHYTDLPPAMPSPSDGPLRILVITASPTDYPLVSEAYEAEAIKSILEKEQVSWRRFRDIWRYRFGASRQQLGNPPIVPKLVEVEVLAHATRRTIQHQINLALSKNCPFHVIHFVGHGISQAEGTYLLLEKEVEVDGKPTDARTGDGDFILASDFAELLGRPAPYLIFLNACETGPALKIFSGAAYAFFRRGTSIVVGMQTEVLDQAALRFAQEFYQAWAVSAPFDRALASARRLVVSDTQGQSSDWAIPVVYAGPDAALDLRLNLPPLWGILALFRTWKSIVGLAFVIGLIATYLNLGSMWTQANVMLPGLRCHPNLLTEWAGNPNRLEGEFNAIMAPLIVESSDKSTLSEWDGELLAEQIWNQFSQSLERNGRLDVSVQHRSAAQTCALKGNTPALRRNSAAEIAEIFNANLVVYGVIRPGRDADSVNFQPEFWVNYGGFAETADINGRYALGRPIAIDIPVESSHFQGRIHPASARIEALSLLALGLAALSQNNYQTAIANFEKAEALPGWYDWQGKHAVYLFLGNAYLIKAQAQDDSFEEDQSLDKALRHYQRASDIAKKYGEPVLRTELGVGNVQYIQRRKQLDQLFKEFDVDEADSGSKLGDVIPMVSGQLTSNPPTNYIIGDADANKELLSMLHMRITTLDTHLTDLELDMAAVQQEADAAGIVDIADRAQFNLAQIYIARHDLLTVYERYDKYFEQLDYTPLPKRQWMKRAYGMLFQILCDANAEAIPDACAAPESTSVSQVCLLSWPDTTFVGELTGYTFARMALIAYIYEDNIISAEKCYEHALAILPEQSSVDYYIKLAELYRQQANWKAANDMFEKVIVKGEKFHQPKQVMDAFDSRNNTEGVLRQRARWGH